MADVTPYPPLKVTVRDLVNGAHWHRYRQLHKRSDADAARIFDEEILLTRADILHLLHLSEPGFKVGDRVRVRNDGMNPGSVGHITNVDNGTYTVRWEYNGKMSITRWGAESLTLEPENTSTGNWAVVEDYEIGTRYPSCEIAREKAEVFSKDSPGVKQYVVQIPSEYCVTDKPGPQWRKE